MLSVSSNLKYIMHEKDYSVDRLAHETGISRSTINRARGELIVTCRLITLVKIAEALSVKPKSLFECEEKKNFYKPPRKVID